VLCCAVLCWSALCCAVLRCAALRCAVPCRSEVSAERVEQALHRKRDPKLHHTGRAQGP
jgi:hypothetical protein